MKKAIKLFSNKSAQAWKIDTVNRGIEVLNILVLSNEFTMNVAFECAFHLPQKYFMMLTSSYQPCTSSMYILISSFVVFPF